MYKIGDEIFVVDNPGIFNRRVSKNAVGIVENVSIPDREIAVRIAGHLYFLDFFKAEKFIKKKVPIDKEKVKSFIDKIESENCEHNSFSFLCCECNK